MISGLLQFELILCRIINYRTNETDISMNPSEHFSLLKGQVKCNTVNSNALQTAYELKTLLRSTDWALYGHLSLIPNTG